MVDYPVWNFNPYYARSLLVDSLARAIISTKPRKCPSLV
jgi:hypothetical protein